jgi:hypothetical protein
VHEGFLEVFAQPMAGEPTIDPADASPPVLAESTVEAGAAGPLTAFFSTHTS